MNDINAAMTIMGLNTYTTPSAPPQAALWGFNTNKLNETWSGGTSDIDLNNTLAANYTWYVAPFASGQVPSASDFTYSGGTLNIQAGTLSATYRSRLFSRGLQIATFQATAAGTVLTVSSMNTGTIIVGQTLAGSASIPGGTTILSLGTGTGGTGTYNLSQSVTIVSSTKLTSATSTGNVSTFNPGGYYEACYGWNPANTLGNSSVSGTIAWWMQDQVGLFSQSQTSGYGTAATFLEIDHFEGLATGTIGVASNAFTLHDWTNTNGGGIGTNNSSSNSSATNSQLGNPTFTNQHCYGTLWILSSQFGGIGVVRRYFDGIVLPFLDVTYSSGAGSSPSATPSNPNGVFFDGESDNFVLMIEGGYQQPINISKITAWH